jgi:single-strand DNA-binding protein
LSKGALVLIEGRLRTRNWQDSTGITKYRTEIVGESMQLGPKSGTGKSSIPLEPQEAPPQEKSNEEIPIVEEGGEIDIKDVPF